MKKLIILLTHKVTLGIMCFTLLLVTSCETKDRFVKVVDKVLPAVVTIHVVGIYHDPATKQAQTVRVGGSGVFINDQGEVLTAAHLFPKELDVKSVLVELENGDVIAADAVKVSTKSDLAVLRTTFFDKTPFVKLADPRGLKVGQEVVAVGSPFGLSSSVTTGVISALYRDFPASYNMTQSDAAINPGNSGGPLFDLQGNLVGINVFIISSSPFAPAFCGLSFSVQSGQCLEFLAKNKIPYTLHKEKSLKDYLKEIL